MSKLFTRATVSSATLTGANLKATLTALWDALNTGGFSDSSRVTVTTTSTLATTQCGLLLIDATAASIVLTLPASGSASDDASYSLRRIDSTANTVTVQRAGADTVEGGTNITLPVNSTTAIQLPGGAVNWRVSGINGPTAAATRTALGVSASGAPADELVNAQIGITYTYLTGDKGKLVTHSNAAAIAGTLPQAGASFPSGWWVDVQNRGAGTLTITPTTSTIDGATSLALTTGQGVRLASDGANYFTQRGAAAAAAAQTPQNVAASRVVSTNYTNSTGQTIFVNFTCTTGAAACTGVVNSVTVAKALVGASAWATLSFPVPNGLVYSIAAPAIDTWVETR